MELLHYYRMGGLGICGVYVNSFILERKGSRKHKLLVMLRVDQFVSIMFCYTNLGFLVLLFRGKLCKNGHLWAMIQFLAFSLTQWMSLCRHLESLAHRVGNVLIFG